MTLTLLGTLAGGLLGWLMGFLSLFLILLVLIQRGKGGGLTGALGGPGGQSAFGSKAGDTFTVITIVVASIWGLTCAFTMWLLGTHAPTPVSTTNVQAGPGDDSTETPATPSDLIVPPAGSGGLSGLEGLQLTPNTTDDSSSETPSGETPSVELTPADGSGTSDAGSATPGEPAAEEPTEPAAETPDAPEPATETRGPSEPAADATSNAPADEAANP